MDINGPGEGLENAHKMSWKVNILINIVVCLTVVKM